MTTAAMTLDGKVFGGVRLASRSKQVREEESVVADGYAFVETIALDTNLGAYFLKKFLCGETHMAEVRLIKCKNHYSVYRRT